MKNKPLYIKTIFVCIVMSIVFLVSMIMAYSISDSVLDKNVRTSANTIIAEGPYLRKGKHSYTQLDNYTEAYMLNMAIHQDGEPIKSAILNPFYENERVINNPYYERLVSVVDGIGKEANASYGRYWQGSLTILRPLLMFFTLKQIYIVNQIVLFVLCLISGYLLKRRAGYYVAVALLLSLAAVSIWYISLSTKYYPSFVIALLGIIYFGLSNKKYDSDQTFIVFIVLGGVVAFFDFFSTPLVTLALPLLSLLMIHSDEIENKRFKEVFKDTNKLIFAWVAGYLLLLLIKALLYIFVSNDPIVAFSGITLRLNNWMGNARFKSLNINRFSGVINTFDVFIPFINPKISIFVFVVLTLSPIVINCKSNLIYLVTYIALLPFVWWIMFSTSVHQHAWAVYRTVVINIYAICCNYINLERE